RVGMQAGFERLAELTVAAPLVLPEHGAVALQLVVDGADDEEHHTVEVYARADGAAGEQRPWTPPPPGTFIPDEMSASDAVTSDLVIWPPEGGVEVDLDGGYERLVGQGYDYGPAFRGLRRVWRHGVEIFAEVALADALAAEMNRFAPHPALLDATL